MSGAVKFRYELEVELVAHLAMLLKALIAREFHPEKRCEDLTDEIAELRVTVFYTACDFLPGRSSFPRTSKAYRDYIEQFHLWPAATEIYEDEMGQKCPVAYGAKDWDLQDIVDPSGLFSGTRAYAGTTDHPQGWADEAIGNGHRQVRGKCH